MSEPIDLTVNGLPRRVDVPGDALLADVLREGLGLYGTRLGCHEGVCGSCTVLLDGDPVRACLVLAGQADGASVTTVEGLAGPDRLSPLQEAFVALGAAQCGFCTAGMLIAATAGYTKIVEAVLAAAPPAATVT